MAKVRIQAPPNLENQPQVFLRERDFNALIWNKGYEVILEKSVRCPCRNIPDHQAIVNCRNCGGTGWLFVNPIATSTVLQSMNYDTKFKDWGEEKIGMAKLTFQERERLSFMDKVTIQNGEMITTEILHPTLWSTGEYMCRTIYPIKSIELCFLFKGVDSKLERLRLGEGIEIDKEQYVVIDSSLYQKDCTISLRYTHSPVFHIIDLPRAVMVSPEYSKAEGAVIDSKFPLLANARLAHLVLDQNNYSGDWLFDNSDFDFCKDERHSNKKADSC